MFILVDYKIWNLFSISLQILPPLKFGIILYMGINLDQQTFKPLAPPQNGKYWAS